MEKIMEKFPGKNWGQKLREGEEKKLEKEWGKKQGGRFFRAALALGLAGACLVACSSGGGAASGGGHYAPGEYSGTGVGFDGTRSVEVTIQTDETSILDVSIDGPNETPEIGGAALEEIELQILRAQSADIDGVSGATMTSDGVREALAAAIAQAEAAADSDGA